MILFFFLLFQKETTSKFDYLSLSLSLFRQLVSFFSLSLFSWGEISTHEWRNYTVSIQFFGRDRLPDPLLRPIWMQNWGIPSFFFFFDDNNDLSNVAKPVPFPPPPLLFTSFNYPLNLLSPSLQNDPDSLSPATVLSARFSKTRLSSPGGRIRRISGERRPPRGPKIIWVGRVALRAGRIIDRFEAGFRRAAEKESERRASCFFDPLQTVSILYYIYRRVKFEFLSIFLEKFLEKEFFFFFFR